MVAQPAKSSMQLKAAKAKPYCFEQHYLKGRCKAAFLFFYACCPTLRSGIAMHLRDNRYAYNVRYFEQKTPVEESTGVLISLYN